MHEPKHHIPHLSPNPNYSPNWNPHGYAIVRLMVEIENNGKIYNDHENVLNITFHGLIGLEKTICYVHFVWGGKGVIKGGNIFNALYPMSPYSSPNLKEHKQFITRHSCNLLLRVRYIHPWANSTKIDSKGIPMSIFQRGLSCCQSGL